MTIIGARVSLPNARSQIPDTFLLHCPLPMDTSLSHLPEHKRAELARLTRLIRESCRDVEMIILYGSYARGDYKEEADLKPDRKSGHASDYDILIVTTIPEPANSIELWNHVTNKARSLPGGLSAHPRLIAYDINSLNERLADGRYFYTDIKKEGRMMYDSRNYTLAEAKELSPEERYCIAQEYFDVGFKNAEDFFAAHTHALREDRLKNSAFQLHQAAEAAYKTILLVFTGYSPNEHWLAELSRMAAMHDESILEILPQETDEGEEGRLFKLLDYAYIGARYDPKYTITAEELDYLSACVRTLLDRTQSLCTAELERIKP